MYICYCGKGHKLSDEHYEMIDGVQELRLQHECGFDIIIGGEDDGPYDEETGFGGIYMYSFDTKDLPEKEREERLAKIKSITAEVISIRMKCGHDATWRGFTASSICCGDCGWDKNGRNSGNTAAWEQDYEYMYPELHK